MLKYGYLIEKHPNLFDNECALIKIVTDQNLINSWMLERKKKLAEKGLPEKWAEIGVVYEDPFIIIIRDLVRLPSGRLSSYFRVTNSADLKGGQGTVVLPLIGKKILIMKQFRHPTRRWHWEFPRGFGEPNTSPKENALKEIQEEVQGNVIELVDLGLYHSNTGLSGNAVQLYLARLSSVGETNKDEGIDYFKIISAEKVETMIRNEEITDGFTIAAFTRASLRNLI